MLPVRLISDNQILGTRVHLLPVRVESLTSYVLDSKSRPELLERHRVTFDSSERPSLFACTCEAFTKRQKACWAAARALDVLVLLLANNVTVGRLDADDEGRERAADTDECGDAPAPESLDDARERADFHLKVSRVECRRTHKAPEPEGNPEAVLAAPRIVKVGKVERVRGFQI